MALLRAALYIDGFNFYHSLDDLGQNHLKWLNMWALGELLIPGQSQKLTKVVCCTAVRGGDPAKAYRHRQYLKALKAAGVTCLEGHFAKEQRDCRDCGRKWQAPVEKQGDVNLALAMLDDAYRDEFDHAYLLTADSDQAATVRILAERFPEKPITTLSPPGRSHCKEILAITPHKIAVSQQHVERCLFPKQVIIGGQWVVTRDPSYDPPAGWSPA